MTNEKLLARIERWPHQDEWTKEDDEALAQLRAMLKEPTDEEQAKMLEDFEYILAASGLPESDWTPGIRAAIKAKRTVTRRWVEDFADDTYANISDGTVEEVIEKKLAELGYEVKK